MKAPKELLRELGLKPKDSWGQNFLGDDQALSEIVEAAGLTAGDIVVELGPGLGHLTRHIVDTGATVVAVERDRDMVRALELQAIKGVTVVAGNATEVDFAQVGQADQVVVMGNLPYHLSSQILFRVLEQVAHVRRAVFTLQKEVVERLAAPPSTRDYGLLTVLLGLWFDIEHCLTLPAHLFHPPPKVDSAVVRLERLAAPKAAVTDAARFRKVVKAGFAQRRKTLSNSLQSDASLFERRSVAEVLQAAGIDGKRRAETLSPEEFAAIERALG